MTLFHQSDFVRSSPKPIFPSLCNQDFLCGEDTQAKYKQTFIKNIDFLSIFLPFSQVFFVFSDCSAHVYTLQLHPTFLSLGVIV